MRLRLLLPAALLLVLLAAPSGARAATTRPTFSCPTFSVLHDDHIGRLSLPAGTYAVSVSGGLSCGASTPLFAEFLADFDGVLPRPWSYRVLGRGRGVFRSSSGASFTVSRRGSGPKPSGDLTCAGQIVLPGTDRIGALVLAKGSYRLTRLTPRISCGRAQALFASFLQDFDGRLPGGWVVLPQSGAFVNGAVNYGFRIKRQGGGGHHPTNETRCGPTFRVVHNDFIGRLKLPAGNYAIFVRALTCATASTLFASFLNRPDGSLPPPWRLNAATGTFTRGSGPARFRVKLL